METTLRDKLRFRLQDLSTYRSELMGWSIVWIMMLHFRFITLKPLGFIAQYGFAGVEIFMFVSGLGLYYSLEKDSRLGAFYAKRLKRIFPVYYLIGFAASLLIFHDGLLTYLFRYSTLGFWTGHPYFEWYIPSIVFLYLLAPAIKLLVTPRRCPLLVAACIVLLIAAYFVADHQSLARQHFFLFYRIPAFVMGMCTGMLIRQQRPATPFFVALLAGLPVFLFCFPKHHVIYEFKYYSLFFLLPFFMLVFCTISKVLGKASSVLRQIGNASLEVYLIQTLFFSAFCAGLLTVSPAWHDAVTLLLMVVCSVAGILLHRWLPW